MTHDFSSHYLNFLFRKMYKCPVCQSAYSKDDLEYLLLDMVQRNTMAYTIQDLQCKKCLEVKSLLNYVFNLNLKLFHGRI